jgi:hypothetical protein
VHLESCQELILYTHTHSHLPFRSLDLHLIAKINSFQSSDYVNKCSKQCNIMNMRTEVFRAATTNTTISVVYVYKYFIATCRLQHQGRLQSTFLLNVTGWIPEPVWMQQSKIALAPAGNQTSVHSESLHRLSYPGSYLITFK